MKKYYYTQICLFSVWLAFGCLPKERYSQFTVYPDVQDTGDSLHIKMPNPISAPLRVKYAFKDDTFAIGESLVLQASDTLRFSYDKQGKKKEISSKDLGFWVMMGDSSTIDTDALSPHYFPFPKGKTYTVIQGYFGKFSHSKGMSTHALDFNLQVGDTVCASKDGVVVGIIKDYDVGGNNRKYRDFANFITLYHYDGTLTQYVHLKKDGVLVNMGDTVKALDPIAISGVTGFTAGPHLHFNTLVQVKDGFAGYPATYHKIEGKNLKKGMRVNND